MSHLIRTNSKLKMQN